MIKCPKISVVIPSCNQGQFLRETIESILGQGYANLEFIIIDGGSDDGSKEIIKHYSDRLDYWQSKPDKGQTDAIIQGFERATGDLMGWVNSDDVLLPGALHHIAYAYTQNHGAGMFIGNYVLIDQAGKIIRCKRNPKQIEWFCRHGKEVVNPDWFFARREYEQVGGLNPNLEFCMDTDLFFRMILKGTRPVYIDRYLAGFRIHATSKGVAQADQVRQEANELSIYLWKHGVVLSHPAWRLLYRAYQVLNGNYPRMMFETVKARNQHWRNWASEHC